MIEPAHPAPDWRDWLSAISEQINIAKSVGTATPEPEEEDIHRLRAAVKYARALLRLAPPSISDQATLYRKHLKRVAHRLSRFRDRTVLIESLAALSAHVEKPPSTDLSKNARVALQNAKTRLNAVSELIRTLTTPVEHPSELRRAIKRYKNRMQRRKPKHWRSVSNAKIHIYRSALIVHACQMHFLKTARHKTKGKYIRHLDQLRLYLGELNDLDRLVDFSTESRFRDLFDQDKAVVAHARHRQNVLRKKLRNLA